MGAHDELHLESLAGFDDGVLAEVDAHATDRVRDEALEVDHRVRPEQVARHWVRIRVNNRALQLK